MISKLRINTFGGSSTGPVERDLDQQLESRLLENTHILTGLLAQKMESQIF
jgi:hypothetical protein